MKKVIMMILAIAMASVMLCGCEVTNTKTVYGIGSDNNWEVISVIKD